MRAFKYLTTQIEKNEIPENLEAIKQMLLCTTATVQIKSHPINWKVTIYKT